MPYPRHFWNGWRPATGRRVHDGQGWRVIAFVGSTRAVLMRVLREKGAEIAPDARVAVDSLPETFLEWLVIRDRAEVA